WHCCRLSSVEPPELYSFPTRRSSELAGGGGEGEHVVDRRDDLEGALVAVAHDAGDPFGVDDARADDTGDLLLEGAGQWVFGARRSEEHTSELQSRENLVCRLLLEKKN